MLNVHINVYFSKSCLFSTCKWEWSGEAILSHLCMRSLQKLGTFAQGSQSLSEIGQLLRPLPPTLKKVCFGLFHRMQTGCMESLTPLIALSLLWSHGAFTGLDLSCLGLDSPVKISFLASGIHRVVILSLIKNVNDFSNNITLEQSLNPHCFQIKQTNKKGKESVIYLYMNVESLILTFRFKGQHFETSLTAGRWICVEW